MTSYTLQTCLILVLSVHTAFSLNCSGIVTIESEGLLNYLANVSFTVPKAVDGDWTLEMETNLPFTFLGGWGVWITSVPEEGKASFRSRLENSTLSEGDQVSFRFRISWFKGDERPFVTSLKWEDVQLCSEVKDVLEEVKASRRRRTGVRSPERRVNYRKRYYANF